MAIVVRGLNERELNEWFKSITLIRDKRLVELKPTMAPRVRPYLPDPVRRRSLESAHFTGELTGMLLDKLP